MRPCCQTPGGDEERDAGGGRKRRHERRPDRRALSVPVHSHHQRARHAGFITLDAMKIVVIAVLIAIVAALFTALVFLYRDRGRGKRVVWMLTIRVALSVSLIVFLLVQLLDGLDRAGRPAVAGPPESKGPDPRGVRPLASAARGGG